MLYMCDDDIFANFLNSSYLNTSYSLFNIALVAGPESLWALSTSCRSPTSIWSYTAEKHPFCHFFHRRVPSLCFFKSRLICLSQYPVTFRIKTFTVPLSFFPSLRYLILNKSVCNQAYTSCLESGSMVRSELALRKFLICSKLTMCEMFIFLVINYLWHSHTLLGNFRGHFPMESFSLSGDI